MTRPIFPYYVVNDVVAKGNHEQIKVAVKGGQRPDVNAVTGPDALVKHIKDCIERCWHQSPDRRPSFTGRHCLRSSLIGRYWSANSGC